MLACGVGEVDVFKMLERMHAVREKKNEIPLPTTCQGKVTLGRLRDQQQMDSSQQNAAAS
jgi:hypothetical protein